MNVTDASRQGLADDDEFLNWALQLESRLLAYEAAMMHCGRAVPRSLHEFLALPAR
jgi:hypothetical protein